MPLSSYQPAQKKIVIASLAVLAAGIFLFTAVLRHTMRSVTVLNETDYVMAIPEGFVYSCEPILADGALTLRGWAVVQGEGVKTVDCRVVLYDAAAGEYLCLPTMMEIDETPTEVLNDGVYYGRGSFVSIVPIRQLPAPIGNYELCFAYRSNGYNNLICTGQLLEVAGS